MRCKITIFYPIFQIKSTISSISAFEAYFAMFSDTTYDVEVHEVIRSYAR